MMPADVHQPPVVRDQFHEGISPTGLSPPEITTSADIDTWSFAQVQVSGSRRPSRVSDVYLSRAKPALSLLV